MQDIVFHIHTFGCQMNVNDSGWLARMLMARGFRNGGLAEADIVILNTCSVREKPELKVRSALGRIRQETAGREVLVCVSGCVAQQLGEKLFGYSPQVRLVAGTDGIASIPGALEDLLDHPGRRLCLTGFTDRYEERPDALEARVAPSCFVNIMQGCDNFCTYCIVPYTRGRQKSRAHGAVLGECRELVARGASEITLLGQNVNAYGKDRTGDGTSFAALLRQTAAISGLRRLRYVTPHPKDMTGEDVALFGELASLCPRLHLPVQAGSDRVLKRMNRRYTSADFLALVSRLRQACPGIALSTDLIVGFPGETEEDFQATLSLVRQSGFMASYSFCYSDRPGARASLFPDKVPAEEAQDRLLRLQALQEELGEAWYRSRVGDSCELLMERPSPRQDDGDGPVSWQGRDPWGAPVHVALPGDRDWQGAFVKVRITDARKHSLLGEAAGV